MEKLELKHLAPYLAYELSLLEEFEVNKNEVRTLRGIELDMVITTLNRFPFNQRLPYVETKPILRPLSDLTKEIEVDGKSFVPIKELIEKGGLKIGGLSEYGMIKYIQRMPIMVDYWAVNYLFSWHFDVFGLIDAGLAVDVNTLKH
jgi:hypothetical protein